MRVRTILALGTALCSFQAQAQTIEALGVCKSLVNSALVDKTSSAESINLARSEFALFCSDTQNRVGRAAAKGSSFTGSLKYAGVGIGLGSSSSSSSSLTEENIEKVCSERGEEFAASYASTFSSNNGSALARIVTECVKAAQGASHNFIWGTVGLDPTGTSILAELHREADSGQPDLSFSGINRTDRFSDCQVGSKSADNAPMRKDLALSCAVNLTPEEKKSGGAQSVMGTIVFETANGDGPNVPFKSIKEDIIQEFQANAVAPLKAEIARLKADNEQIRLDVGLRPVAEAVNAAIDAKVRVTPEYYIIFADVPLNQQPGVEQKEGFLRRRIMPVAEGICALNHIGFEVGGPKYQGGISIQDGYWELAFYNGYRSTNGGYAGGVCWRWK